LSILQVHLIWWGSFTGFCGVSIVGTEWMPVRRSLTIGSEELVLAMKRRMTQNNWDERQWPGSNGGEPVLDGAGAAGSRQNWPGIGQELRLARESTGRSLAEVADALRIQAQHLQALEEGTHDQLPGAAYAIGFLRSYADYLGMDANEAVARFKEEAEIRARPTPLVFPQPIGEAQRPSGRLALLSVLVAGLAYGGWLIFDNLDRGLLDDIPPPPERLSTLLGQDGGAPDTSNKTAGAQEPAEGETTVTGAMAPATDEPATVASADDATPTEADAVSRGSTAADSAGAAATNDAAVGGSDSTSSVDATDAADVGGEAAGVQAAPSGDAAASSTANTDADRSAAGSAAGSGASAGSATGTASARGASAERNDAAPEQATRTADAEASESTAGADAVASPIDAQAEAAGETKPIIDSAESGSAGTTIPDAGGTADAPTPSPVIALVEPTRVEVAPREDVSQDTAGSAGIDASNGEGERVAAADAFGDAVVAEPVEGHVAVTPLTDTDGTADRAALAAGANGPPASADQVKATTDEAGASSAATTSASAATANAPATAPPPVPSGNAFASTSTAGGRDAVSGYRPQVYGAANGDARLVLRARADSWVQIQGADNELLLTRILRAGDTYRAPNREDLVLMTGNAGAIELILDGESLGTLGPVGEVRRGIPLKADTVRLQIYGTQRQSP
jgi:cytoskeletal protein RodZ